MGRSNSTNHFSAPPDDSYETSDNSTIASSLHCGCHRHPLFGTLAFSRPDERCDLASESLWFTVRRLWHGDECGDVSAAGPTWRICVQCGNLGRSGGCCGWRDHPCVLHPRGRSRAPLLSVSPRSSGTVGSDPQAPVLREWNFSPRQPALRNDDFGIARHSCLY